MMKSLIFILSFTVCWTTAITAAKQSCPHQCQCTRSKWTCEKRKIVDNELVEISQNGDPSQVTEILLNNNRITNFPANLFYNFTKLWSIQLRNNELTKLPENITFHIPTLRKLSLGNNRVHVIRKEDLIGYQNLTTLDLFGNGITDLEPNLFEYAPNLEELYFESNRIKHLKNGTLNGLRRLQSLSFADNQIKSIEGGVFQECTYIENLFLEVNALESLPKDLLSFAAIYSLKLSDNLFTDDSFKEGSFDVNEIYLNDNKLTTIKSEWFIYYEDRILDIIEVWGNPLNCDCQFYHNYRSLEHVSIEGECETPTSLKETETKLFLEKNLLNCTICSLNKCQNNATCQPLWNRYKCVCRDQFYGEFCQFQDQCRGNLCRNNSTCQPNGNETYICLCGDKLFGEFCQFKDQCWGNLCRNNSTCQANGNETYICLCGDKLFGEYCQFEDPCFDQACANNGSCQQIKSNCSEIIVLQKKCDQYSFKCNCSSGFHGEKCEMEKACYFNNPCQNNGTCQPDETSDKYHCLCVGGYSGQNCEIGSGKTSQEGNAPDPVLKKPVLIAVVVTLALTVLSAVVTVYLCFRRRKRRVGVV